ncbi:MAG TPA: hypothetical protein VLB27_09880, partial [candidate division Zixibacteria bacterium]|nr:hypothetical protein [candidate division Zixibacteria bacterium]
MCCRLATHSVGVGLTLVSLVLTIFARTQSNAQFPEPVDSTETYLTQYYYGDLRRFYITRNTGGFNSSRVSDGGLWVGGVVGSDTIVSAASDGWNIVSFSSSDFNPGTYLEQLRTGTLPLKRSIIDNPSGDTRAKSFADVIFHYTDTILSPVVDEIEGRQVGPLGLTVTQTSYYWDIRYAGNILLIDYDIANITNRAIRDCYLGLFLDARDGPRGMGQFDSFYVTNGYIERAEMYDPAAHDCELSFPFNLPWTAEPSGKPNLAIGEFDSSALNHIIGLQILSPDDFYLQRSWNWWNTNGNPEWDFGPRKAGTPERPFRDWGRRLGTPFGDRNRYHVMSNGEIDYDQYYTALDHSADGWLPPPPDARAVIDGRFDAHALYSIGPFDLSPGDQIDFTVAVIVSDSFHRVPEALWEKLDEYDPAPFYERDLDFSRLIRDATYARWIYDNPGVDTDNDGYRGEYRLCDSPARFVYDTILTVDTIGGEIVITPVIDSHFVPATTDTIWLTGDGTPDLRGVMTPEEPNVRFTHTYGRIALEWNGLRTETTRDFFTRELDFEGYRVYLGLAPRRDDLLLQSSYDIEDFTQWYFDPATRPGALSEPIGWRIARPPFTLTEARAAYGGANLNWHPLIHGPENPLRVGDSAFYFTDQDYNQSDLRDTMQIHKI